MYFDKQDFMAMHKCSAYYAMLSGTYYAHYYASIIGGSLLHGGFFIICSSSYHKLPQPTHDF